MKINPGYRPLGQERARSDNPVRPLQHKSFSDIMSGQEQLRSEAELQRKLNDIYQQGERLARNMTVRELKLYRQMVKTFLEDTARRGVGLKETKGWDRRGRTKRYKLLDEIDQALVSLAEDLLESEQGRIELLGKIGEIRGMLINLFF